MNGKARTGSGSDKAALEAAADKLSKYVKGLRNFDHSGVHDRWDPRVEALQKRINATLLDIFGGGTPEYKEYSLAPLGSTLETTMGQRYSQEELRDALKKEMEQAAVKLTRAKELLANWVQNGGAPAVQAGTAPEPAPAPPPAPAATRQPPAPAPAASAAPSSMPTPSPAPSSQAQREHRVAVVGGTDAGARDMVSAFVTQMGLEPVVLATTPDAFDSGSLDRLEGLRQLDFAIVLLSQGAPGALLELGFLLGMLDRSRVCLLMKGDTKAAEPGGLARYPVDDAGLWHLLLARQMRQAGLDVDLNRAV